MRARILSWSLTLSVGTLAMLLAHCAGYQAASIAAPASSVAAHAAHGGGRHASPHELGHGHLLPVASGAFALAVVAFLAVAVLLRRHPARHRLRLGHLIGVQLAALAVLEVVERVVQHVPAGSLLRLEVLLALLLQVPIAVAVVWLCRRALAAVADLLDRVAAAPRLRAPAIFHLAPTEHHPVTLHWALLAGRRGPPARTNASI